VIPSHWLKFVEFVVALDWGFMECEIPDRMEGSLTFESGFPLTEGAKMLDAVS